MHSTLWIDNMACSRVLKSQSNHAFYIIYHVASNSYAQCHHTRENASLKSLLTSNSIPILGGIDIYPQLKSKPAPLLTA